MFGLSKFTTNRFGIKGILRVYRFSQYNIEMKTSNPYDVNSTIDSFRHFNLHKQFFRNYWFISFYDIA